MRGTTRTDTTVRWTKKTPGYCWLQFQGRDRPVEEVRCDQSIIQMAIPSHPAIWATSDVGWCPMKFSEFLQDIGRPIVYYPSMNAVTGSANATIFLSRLVQWLGTQNDPDGWIYKTRDEFTEETGLSRWEQEAARKQLRSAGLLHEERRGVPARLYYRVDLDVLNAAWENRSNKKEEKPPTGKRGTDQQDGEETSNYPFRKDILGKTIKRETLAPDFPPLSGFALTDEMIDWAIAEGFSTGAISHETDKFVAWMRSEGKVVANSIERWKLWMYRTRDKELLQKGI